MAWGQARPYNFAFEGHNCHVKGEEMAARIIDGEAVAKGIRDAVKADAVALRASGRAVHLFAVQVGANAASQVYVRNQQASCEELGIDYTLDVLPAETSEAALIDHLGKLNASSECTGIILQMPLPEQIDRRKAQAAITPSKDVEGMNPANMGMVIAGDPYIGPCTALGAVELVYSLGLRCEAKIPDWVEQDIKRRGLKRGLYGKEVVVVGHSEIVGKPIGLLLLNQYCTVTTCHIGTQDLGAHTRRADILVVAVGKPGLVNAGMIKPGAVVIDVGINRVGVVDAQGKPVLNEKGKPKMKTVGDVDFATASAVAGWITPVPGGVGPMTVAILVRNTVRAAQAQAQ